MKHGDTLFTGYRFHVERAIPTTADGVEQIAPPGERMQICSFLWVYYGYPASAYEGRNVEAIRNRCGAALARRDDDGPGCPGRFSQLDLPRVPANSRVRRMGCTRTPSRALLHRRG